MMLAGSSAMSAAGTPRPRPSMTMLRWTRRLRRCGIWSRWRGSAPTICAASATRAALMAADHLREAADVIASEARNLARSWSRQIPPSIRVESDGKVATVSSRAGPARPAEYRLRHPLFGDRRHWYGPPGEPFREPLPRRSAGRGGNGRSRLTGTPAGQGPVAVNATPVTAALPGNGT